MKATQHFTLDDILTMEQRSRANFINGLSGYKSANLIGTQNASGQTNLAIVSSVVHIGAHPPLLGMIMRPHTVRRDTLQNIKSGGNYTINAVSTSFFKQAHQTSARYDESEFAATGLTPWYSDAVRAPYVDESPLKIGLSLEQITPLACNNTELVIGRVTEVFIDDAAVEDDGNIAISQLALATISGLDTYHSAKLMARMEYAKPDLPPRTKQ